MINLFSTWFVKYLYVLWVWHVLTGRSAAFITSVWDELRWVGSKGSPGSTRPSVSTKSPARKWRGAKTKGKKKLRGPKKQVKQKQSATMGYFSHFSFLFRFSTSLLSLCTLLNSQMCVFSVPCLVFMSVFHTCLLSSEQKRILLSGAWYIYIHQEEFILPYYRKALNSSHKLLVNKFWTQLNHPQYCGPSWLISDMLGTIVSSPTIWAQLTPPQ